MGYEFLESRYIKYNNQKHKVFCYTRYESIGLKKHLHHLLLTPLTCVDARYLEDYEDEDELKLINFDSPRLEEDFAIASYSFYDGFIIYQFSETGDEIQVNPYTEVYQSLKSFYQTNEENTFVFDYDERNIETPRLFKTYTNLTERYIFEKYCMLPDKILNYFKGIFEIKYGKIILFVVLTAILVYVVIGILRNYLDSATISLLLTIPAAMYYSWNLYEKYKNSRNN
ncbi:hypothetical protein CI957_42 [Methanohalophilus sp. WG1-DM]|nr:hypothetical protein CI957_42 [Methanohalophilus sp. WG1-DM]